MEPVEIAIIGVALLGFSLVSRRSDRWLVTMPMVFVAVGAALSASGVVEVSAARESVGLFAEVTLAVILFSDATRISLPRLRRQLALPARLLGIGLPLTIVTGALLGRLLFSEWALAEIVLLAAVLAPTDAALGSAVVENEAVPIRERLALNVESGLNDGLVVPIVALCTSLVLESGRSSGYWVNFVLRQIGVGVAVGVAAGLAGIMLLRRAHAAEWSDGRYEQIATFGLPIIALCGSVALDGNGFIAAFVAGLAFGSGGLERRPRPTEAGERSMDGPMEAEHFAEFTEDAAQLLGVVAFLVFGNLFVGDAVGSFGPAVIVSAIASLTIVRMLPVAIALTGTGMRLPTKLFIGWFGPRGLASIVFGILLLEELEERGARADQLFGVISLTVTLSVLLHGATASIGAQRYGRWVADRQVGPVEAAPTPEMMPRARWSGRRGQA
ncbi:MAG: sodium:proton exchanger [Ilumatobacter sp.]|nr:sodium:proton exchanger [Ilumatobacter sp.]